MTKAFTPASSNGQMITLSSSIAAKDVVWVSLIVYHLVLSSQAGMHAAGLLRVATFHNSAHTRQAGVQPNMFWGLLIQSPNPVHLLLWHA